MTTTNTEIEINCSRCGGHGNKPVLVHGHVCSDTCFECNGTGVICRHYTVACDNVSECVGRKFATWEEAKAWSVELSERNGCTYRVAKFDGKGWRYRDGQRVKWAR